MGASVSTGANNDELVDRLVESEYIKTPLVQRVFRAVDRGNYFTPEEKQNAYKDVSWKMGNLHLSAPCVYSVVLEHLKMKPGLSFLNIGSGTGFFNTVAGLILGIYGVNHGIELYSEVVDFANERLEEFLKDSNGVDMYDFCEPTFVVGNCLTLDTPCQQYDRVYCGASCPEEYELYIKNLVKVGGILVMPLNDKLLQMTRTSESTWQAVKILSVAFAPLLTPPSTKEPPDGVNLSDTSPPKLQNLCRSYIRTILRDNINREHPNLELKLRKKDKRPRRQVQRIVIPFYDDTDLSANQSTSELEYEDTDRPEFKLGSRIPTRMSIFLEDFLRRHAELQLLREMHDQHSNSSDEMQPPVPPPGESSSDDNGSDDDMNVDNPSNELVSVITVSNVGQSSSGDDASNFSKPPSQSTRSRRKRNLKRKHEGAASELPSTSSESSPPEPQKKAKQTSPKRVWGKLVDQAEGQADANSSSGLLEENYSDLMVEKIKMLPIPSILQRYLNYRRDNL